MRYWFHVDDVHGRFEAAEAVELADGDAAQAFAVASARSMLAHDILDGAVDLSRAVVVEPEIGDAWRVEFAAMLENVAVTAVPVPRETSPIYFTAMGEPSDALR